MCGIVGKVFFDPQKTASEPLIESFAQCLAHRGPDDQGTYVKGNVGLGFRRLAIIDLSPAGHQPMSNEDGTVWIVFNGEIYNYQSLRPDLEKRGHTFRSRTDTETIIHLYEEYGEDCLRFLRGMFAFAIWDQKKRRLFLARDRAGKKPLKYYLGSDFITFGSELKAILRDDQVPRELDTEAVYHYLTYQYVPHPMTGFRGIQKLPPAHFALIDLATSTPKITIKQYWDLDFSRKLQLSVPEWQERIISTLDESVRLRMMSDVPLGAFLSGGVDSSAIVALMSKHSTAPIKTFSIGFTEQSFNELPYAKQVADQYHTDHQEFVVEANAIEVLPTLVASYEEPYADSSALPTFYLSQMTRRYVTVALNGDGGDESFAGYPWYEIMRRAGYYRRLPHPIRQLGALVATGIFSRSHNLRARYGLLFAEAAAAKNPALLHTELLAYFNRREKRALLTPAFQAQAKAWHSEQFLERFYETARTTDPVDAAQYVDIHSYLADGLLAKVDIASMANSLEARSPFLDHELMELAAQIPSELKLHQGVTKYLLKKSLEPYLPESILYRKKHGFSVPIDAWFRTSLREYAHDHLLNDSAKLHQFVAKESIAQLLHAHASGASDGKRIWALVTLELWLQQFFGRSA